MMLLQILIRRPIEFYNGIVQCFCHSTAFLLVFVCRLRWIICHRGCFHCKVSRACPLYYFHYK